MTKKALTIIFEWLERNTNNFEYKNTNDKTETINEVLFCIQRQENLIEQGVISKKQLPIAIWFNIFQNHYLANGNKRLAFTLYHYYKYPNVPALRMTVDDVLSDIFYDYEKELKYLEDK